MAASVGNLSILISANARPFQQGLIGVRSDLATFGRSSIGSQAGSGLQGGFMSGFAGGLAGAMVLQAGNALRAIPEGLLSVASRVGSSLAEFLKDSFDAGLQFDSTKLALSNAFGGDQQGLEFLKQLRTLSAASGYEMQSLSKAALGLAGRFKDPEHVLPVLRAITEMSAGIGADAAQMDRFAIAVGQVASNGRLFAEELNQLAENGGLSIQMLAETMRKSVPEFRKLAESGAIGPEAMFQTLDRLTDAGGKFYDILGKRSQSAAGQVGMIRSEWAMLQAEVGTGLLQGMQEVGLFNAIRSGLGWLQEQRPLVVESLDGITTQFKVFAASTAGAMGELTERLAKYSNFFIENFVRPILKGTEALVSMMADLNKLQPDFMKNDFFDTVLKGLKKDIPAILDNLDKFRIDPGNRGNDWAKGMWDAFNNQPNAQMMPRPAFPQELLQGQGDKTGDALKAAMDRFPGALARGSQEAASVLAHAMHGTTTAKDREFNELRDIKEGVQDVLPVVNDLLKVARDLKPKWM